MAEHSSSVSARAARVEAARAWHARQPRHTAPVWPDVELLAAMNVTEPAVLELLLLDDRPRVLASWNGLRAALTGHDSDPPVIRWPATSEPRESRTHESTVHEPTVHEPTVHEPTVHEPTVREAGNEPITGETPTASMSQRFAALIRWRESALTTAPGLSELDETDLRRIARSSAVTVEAINRLSLRAKRVAIEHAHAISEVLRRADSAGSGPNPVPTTGPNPGLVSPPSGQPFDAASAASSPAVTRQPAQGAAGAPAHAAPAPVGGNAGVGDTAARSAAAEGIGEQQAAGNNPAAQSAAPNNLATQPAAPNNLAVPPNPSAASPVGSAPFGPPAAAPAGSASPITADGPGGPGRWAAAPTDPHEQAWLADRTFAAFSWDVPSDPDNAAPLRARAEPGGVLLSWPASPFEADGWFGYRVVSSEEYPPTSSPDTFELLGATRRRDGLDQRAPRHAVRHYAVWINHGPDEAAARSGQPVLHAAGFVVQPVEALAVRVEGSRVFGQWHTLEGVGGVKVMRIPSDRLATYPGYDPGLTFPGELKVKASGFTDSPPTGGAFTYRVYAVADVTGRDVLSAPVDAEVTIAENVDPVSDLTVHRQPDDTLTLGWTPPRAGRVEIYRLASPPPPGLVGQLLSREALTTYLPDEARLIQSTDQINGRAEMSEVNLPKGWTRAYFVPVTALDGRHLRVGSEQVLILPSAPTQVRCVERVRAQVLSFAWPEGVELVRVHTGPKGAPPTSATSAPLAELTRTQYDEQGGIHLPTPLPGDGCELHLFGVSYYLGEPVLSAPASLTYPGLIRVEYRWQIETQAETPPARGLFGRSAPPAPAAPVVRRLQVWSSHRLDRVRLLLVHNDSRLPLHSHDGAVVLDQEASIMAREAPIIGPPLTVTDGYVRLFIVGLAPGHAPVAVLDPAITSLRLS